MSDEPLPSVLVVIPTLGTRNQLFEQTLRSIRSQQGVDVLLIVVTPTGATEARSLAKQFDAVVLDDPGSHSGAINSGFSAASEQCKYGNWIGDDDLLLPGALLTAARALDANPGSTVAFGYCDYIDDDGTRLFTSRAGRFAPWLMTWGPDLVPQPGALMRLSSIRQVGGLDATLSYAMDLDLFLKLRKIGSFTNTRTTLAAFRWHADSKTVANRGLSLAEGERIKRMHLPPAAARTAWLWEGAVRVATRIAARHVERLARSRR